MYTRAPTQFIRNLADDAPKRYLPRGHAKVGVSCNLRSSNNLGNPAILSYIWCVLISGLDLMTHTRLRSRESSSFHVQARYARRHSTTI
jgi:hypothetical protein